MRELIKLWFNDGDAVRIGVTKYGAIWTNNQQKYKLLVNETSLKLVINYLLDNYYFTLGNIFFRQLGSLWGLA